MSDFRFIIDDYDQSKTQRTILRDYSNQLISSYGVEIIWASELEECSYWPDVPGESARRLGLRIMALRPTTGLHTVFLPGHIVPGELAPPQEIEADIARETGANLANFDLFVVNNGSEASKRLEELLEETDDYNRISGFSLTSSTVLPRWLSSGNLTSCLLLDDRPWYSAHSATRERWARLVADLVMQDKLSLSTVREDVRGGLLRPSSLVDIQALIDDEPLAFLVPPTIDSVFVYPELDLSPSQYRLLHSPELKERLLSYQKSRKRKRLKVKNLSKRTIRSALGNTRSTDKKRISRALGLARKSIRRFSKSAYRHTRNFLYSLYKLCVAAAESVLKLFNRDK